MDKNAIIISLATFLAVLAGIMFFFRGRLINNNKKRRRSDKGLSVRQRKAIDQAKSLYSQGKSVEASKLLESIGLYREAVNLLQECGQIDEAASILIRLGRPNRAGVIYTRNGKWEKAVECFKIANMPLEVARCAREARDFKTASSYFLKTEHFSEAAECFAEQGDRKKSAKYHCKAGNHSKAIEQYIRLFEETNDPSSISFEPEELDFFVEAIVRGNTTAKFAHVLDANDRLPDAIINLIRFGNIQGAATLYSFSKENIDQVLLDSLGLSKSAGENLGKLFRYVDNHIYAGKAFEKIENLKEAALSFEEAEDFEEAARCYKILGNDEKYIELMTLAGNFSATQSEPTAKLRASDFSGLEGTQNISTPNDADDVEHHDVSLQEDEGDLSDDTRTLADETLELVRTSSGKDHNEVRDETSQNESVASKTKINEVVPAPPKSINEMTDRRFEDEVIEVDEEEEQIDNRGGNLPDEKYKVKANADNLVPPKPSDMNDVFSRSKILYDLKKDEKRLLWKLGETHVYKSGDVLLEPNQTPLGMYFVLSGSLTIIANANSSSEDRREIYPGETIASTWVFLDELIESRILAKETTEVRIIAREDMQLLLDNNGTLARKLYKNMTRQIRFELLTNRNQKSFNQAS